MSVDPQKWLEYAGYDLEAVERLISFDECKEGLEVAREIKEFVLGKVNNTAL
jgi:hypothetical protein